MAVTDPSDQTAGAHTQPPVNTPTTPVTGPWYARVATTAGRPAVLTATLLMSMPGEYHVARLAGWSDPWAYGMPFSLSAYAGIAAVVSAVRPKGARGRLSAVIGATLAILLALAAQVVAHEVGTRHMEGNQAWLIAVTSMVPPAVLAHLLHLAATPVDAPLTRPVNTPTAPVGAQEATPVAAPAMAVTAPAHQPPSFPPVPTAAPALAPAAVAYTDPRCTAIRALYAVGTRPGTKAMRAAIAGAGLAVPSDGTIRGTLRKEIEQHEPHLANYPAAI